MSGLVAIAMGLGVAANRTGQTVALAWAVLFGALPGALIGEALVAGYDFNLFSWLYDHWPIVSISYVSRFGWIGVITAMLVTGQSTSNLEAHAATDGATPVGIHGHIHLPMYRSVFLCGTGVVAVLSLAEVAASSLVRVPSFGPIAHILIEKFHRSEDGMLVSLSLWLVGASVAVVAVTLVGVRPGQQR